MNFIEAAATRRLIKPSGNSSTVFAEWKTWIFDWDEFPDEWEVEPETLTITWEQLREARLRTICDSSADWSTNTIWKHLHEVVNGIDQYPKSTKE